MQHTHTHFLTGDRSTKQLMFSDLWGRCSGGSLQLSPSAWPPLPRTHHPSTAGGCGAGGGEGRADRPGRQHLRPGPCLSQGLWAARPQKPPLGGTGTAGPQTTSRTPNLEPGSNTRTLSSSSSRTELLRSPVPGAVGSGSLATPSVVPAGLGQPRRSTKALYGCPHLAGSTAAPLQVDGMALGQGGWTKWPVAGPGSLSVIGQVTRGPSLEGC